MSTSLSIETDSTMENPPGANPPQSARNRRRRTERRLALWFLVSHAVITAMAMGVLWLGYGRIENYSIVMVVSLLFLLPSMVLLGIMRIMQASRKEQDRLQQEAWGQIQEHVMEALGEGHGNARQEEFFKLLIDGMNARLDDGLAKMTRQIESVQARISELEQRPPQLGEPVEAAPDTALIEKVNGMKEEMDIHFSNIENNIFELREDLFMKLEESGR